MTNNATRLSIYDGRELWKDLIDFNLVEKETPYGKFLTYSDMETNLYSALRRTASRFPGKIAIVDDNNKSYTYREFLQLVDQFALYLESELNVKPGQHIGCLLFNSIEYCVAFIAAIKIGAVFIPFQTKLRKLELIRLINHSDLECIIFDDKFSSFLDDKTLNLPHKIIVHSNLNELGLPMSFDEELQSRESVGHAYDNALLIFTSGTTSLCKGAVLTNFNIMHAVISYQKILNISENDSTIIATPIYYVTGLIALLGLFITSGGKIFLHKYFDAKRVLQTIKTHDITFFHASPTIFFLLFDVAADFPELPSLRAFACGAANMPPEKILELHQWLPQMEFHTIYGLTETSSPATVFPVDAAESSFIGSSGIPIPGTEFKIVDPGKKVLPIGEFGEVLIKGSNILKEYYKQEVSNLDKDGWLSTGDIGYFNDQGYLYVVDRIKDMIDRGGDKVFSYDVENELHKIPSILDAAVVGIPDRLYGEVVAAMVTCSPNCQYDEEAIKNLLATKMARHEVPVKIMFVEEIPKAENAKTDKKRIREILSSGVEISTEGSKNKRFK